MGRHAVDLTIKRRIHVILFYLLVVLAYLVFGGVVMSFCEYDRELARILLAEEEAARLNISGDEVKILEDSGFCSFPSHDQLQWTTGGGVFYSLTVITTIGYGSFAPRTLWGRIFTVFYALIGLSVIAILLTNIAVVGHDLFRSLLGRAKRTRGAGSVADTAAEEAADAETAQRVFSEESMSGRLSYDELKAMVRITASADDDVWSEEVDGRILKDLRKIYQDNDGLFTMECALQVVARWRDIQNTRPIATSKRVFFATFLCCAVWVFGWSGVFAVLEGWMYYDAVWFSCVTLATIGFGDYVPVTDGGRVAAFFFIAPGIGMVASLFACITNMFEHYRYWLLQRLFSKGLISEKVLVAQGVKACLHNEDDIPLYHSVSNLPGNNAYDSRDAHDTGADASVVSGTPFRDRQFSAATSFVHDMDDAGRSCPDDAVSASGEGCLDSTFTSVTFGSLRGTRRQPLTHAKKVRSVAGLVTPSQPVSTPLQAQLDGTKSKRTVSVSLVSSAKLTPSHLPGGRASALATPNTGLLDVSSRITARGAGLAGLTLPGPAVPAGADESASLLLRRSPSASRSQRLSPVHTDKTLSL